MNAKWLSLLAAGAVLAGGCKSPSQPEPTVERKTVEFVVSSESDLREHMARWAREGWSVHSISGPIPQSDGTKIRRAELSRTK